jgi:hypothetical protein
VGAAGKGESAAAREWVVKYMQSKRDPSSRKALLRMTAKGGWCARSDRRQEPVDEGGCGCGEQLNLKAIRRPEGRRYKSKTGRGRDDSADGEIEERSFATLWMTAKGG